MLCEVFQRFFAQVRHHRTALCSLVVALYTPIVAGQPVLITASQTINIGQTTITPTAGGAPVPLVSAEIIASGSFTVLTISGSHTIASLSLQSGAQVTHVNARNFVADLGQGPVTVGGFWLTTSGDVTIDPGCAISVSGKGFGPRLGTGGGRNATAAPSSFGGGGSHGGNAPMSSRPNDGAAGPSYGSFTHPTQLGSGGGNGYNETTTLQPGSSGGGAVRLIVGGTLTVNGAISSDGGVSSSFGGAGSGGSIWLQADQFAGTGTISATGGAVRTLSGSVNFGGGGRIAVYATASTFAGEVLAFGGSSKAGPGSVYLAYGNRPTELIFANWPATVFEPAEGITRLLAPLVFPDHVNIRVSNTTLTMPQASRTTLRIETAGDLTVDPSASLDVSGLGYGPGEGPGAGGNANPVPGAIGAGGSYGATGRSATGANNGVVRPTYGNFREPTDFGSGGGSGYDLSGALVPGGAGGGAMRLVIGGTLSVNGPISAFGRTAGYGGHGAGGSIWITTNRLAGLGIVSGCRIAVYATDASGFAGALRTERFGDPGTVYTVFGGGSPTLRIGPGQEFPRGVFVLYEPLVLQANESLECVSVSVRLAPELTSGLHIEAGGNITLDRASINMEGRGYPPGAGPGAGGDANAVRSARGAGASYGGTAAIMADPNSGSIRPPYGDFRQPTDFGSGGGRSFNENGVWVEGGAGGGAVRVIAGRTLNVTLGSGIYANGISTNIAGSGSGGSIWITAQHLAGRGNIHAGGGAGAGGGRIAVYANSSTFHDGQLSYPGWLSGTVFASFGTSTPELHYINGGVLYLFEPFVLPPDVNFVFHFGLIRPVLNSGSTLSMDIGGSFTMLSQALLDVSGMGFGPGSGPGAGGNGLQLPNTIGAGGSYGGRGGSLPGINNGIAGSTYGSASRPSDFGSGGGSGYRASGSSLFAVVGGSGGGAIRLNVGGVFRHDGAIRADGTTSMSRAGGGSGGSVWITAGSFTGTGTITANGASMSAFETEGGGGGGGRVAVYSCNHAFSGSVRALGGQPSALPGSIVVSSAHAQLPTIASSFCPGTTAVLRADAGGLGGLTYQWRKNGVDLLDGSTGTGSSIIGSQTTELTVNELNGPDSGSYTLSVTGTCGTATSNAVIVRVGGSGLSLCDSIDFNQNCLFPEDADLLDFLTILAGGECLTCADIDFNNDGLFPSDEDLLAFLRVLAGGTCD
jgi:hypothetical protein